MTIQNVHILAVASATKELKFNGTINGNVFNTVKLTDLNTKLTKGKTYLLKVNRGVIANNVLSVSLLSVKEV